MHTCTILLGKPWTDKRQLTYHSVGEFSFVRGGKYIPLDTYTSEKYMDDRKKRDNAQAASEVKKKKKPEAPENFLVVVHSANKKLIKRLT